MGQEEEVFQAGLRINKLKFIGSNKIINILILMKTNNPKFFEEQLKNKYFLNTFKIYVISISLILSFGKSSAQNYSDGNFYLGF